MKRNIDDAISALRQVIDHWSAGVATPSVRILVYPPEWEVAMLERLHQLSNECAAAAKPIELVDVGAGFVEEFEERPDLAEALARTEADLGADVALGDLASLAAQRLVAILQRPLNPPAVCRVLINTGALATFVSYSAITSEIYSDVAAPAVLAFPGEGDDRSLSLLHLRVDTNYRTPRI